MIDRGSKTISGIIIGILDRKIPVVRDNPDGSKTKTNVG